MIQLRDKQFKMYLQKEAIAENISKLAARMNNDYEGRSPIILSVLNGSFIFAADLVRHFTFDNEIQFIKVSSYDGTDTTGKVTQLLGLSIDITGRDIIIVEDIVDTGTTLFHLSQMLRERGANSIEIAALLTKPGKLCKPIDVKYCAFEIPNDFIVGYGLDYDGMGRHYPDIYVIDENN